MSAGDVKLGKRESKQLLVHPMTMIKKSDGVEVGGQEMNQQCIILRGQRDTFSLVLFPISQSHQTLP